MTHGASARSSPDDSSKTDRPGIIPPGDTQILRTRPGFLFVLLYRQFWWLAPVAVLLAFHAVAVRIQPRDPAPWLATAAWLWLGLGFVWRVLLWLARAYILTNRRIIIRAGIFNVVGAEIPLRRIQHSTINRSLLEQIFDLGTVGITTAGADGPAINLLMVPRPNQILTAIRDAIEKAPQTAPPRSAAPKPGPAPTTTPTAALPDRDASVPVIGLAGGIGSGKSEVAKILASLGCLVVDSDREARQALDRPEVRNQLFQWWGPLILHPDGSVNRAAVADIVFKSDKDRAALEALIHPIVRARRADLRGQARAEGFRAALIDAPLLFEAGVDAECDAVLFVDAPRPARLARVAGRGWGEGELDRRESAQLPLEEKRRRSTLVLVNDGSLEDLRARVVTALEGLIRGRGGRS